MDTERPIRMVYVAGKYSAKDQLEKRRYLLDAEKAALKVLQRGDIPIIPHKITYDFEFSLPDFDWIGKFCLPLLLRCDILVYVHPPEESEGVSKEVAFAKKMGIPVYSLEEYLVRLP